MPNYVINKVNIYGDIQTISKVKKQITGIKDENGESIFTFQSIVPRPTNLDIPSSSEVSVGMEYINASTNEKKVIEERYATYKNGKNRLKECIRLGTIAIDNLKKYGHKDWYSWDISNWGTKWDACDTYVETTEDEIILEFKTAWSTPKPVFFKLAEQYPNLIIDINYADEDLGSNCGSYNYVDGNWHHENGDFEFACLMWGEDPEDYSEENED